MLFLGFKILAAVDSKANVSEHEYHFKNNTHCDERNEPKSFVDKCFSKRVADVCGDLRCS